MYKLLFLFAMAAGCGITPRHSQVHEKHLYVRNTNEDLGRLIEGSKAYSIRFNAVLDFANPIELYMRDSTFDCRLSNAVIMVSSNRVSENAFITPTGLVIRPASMPAKFIISAVQFYNWDNQATQCDTLDEPTTIEAFGYTYIMEQGDMARFPIYAAEDLEAR